MSSEGVFCRLCAKFVDDVILILLIVVFAVVG